MRLSISKSKNSISYYVIRTVRKNGRSTTERVRKLGTHAELLKTLNRQDPEEWAKREVERMNAEEEKERIDYDVRLTTYKRIPFQERRFYYGGYLFLEGIAHKLGIYKICQSISKRYKFEYNLGEVLAILVFGRILFPTSKHSTFTHAQKFLTPPTFSEHDIYRALDVLYEESDFIQSQIYTFSKKKYTRNTDILYYDCTNFFFESEQPNGLRQYGISKEHRPNPIVQMGLFMDGDGVPLAFSINSGNTNEQKTLKPLQEKIMKDFTLSKFVVCTDAGLSSMSNRKFNTRNDRDFITTQSVKTLKSFVKEWALSPKGWHILGSKKELTLSKELEENYYDTVFYKERWINENGLEQRLVVTFCPKYKAYAQQIRQEQVNRAIQRIEQNPGELTHQKQTDYKRFAKHIHTTSDSEVAERFVPVLDTEKIALEAQYDGFYAVATSLEVSIETILKANKFRWKIEECFRIMKTDLKTRPVYLSNDKHIIGHFLICFLALIIYRCLEKELDYRFTSTQILDTLRSMNFIERKPHGFIPAYDRSEVTDALHNAFGIFTDVELLPHSSLKKILQTFKKR